ncbi:MAG: hypothetical protein HRU69_07975 [Flammeovirgaceae bacterium]|nr:MAG: hypothetical protein HRU69_07975 [Flammeovirgaceae bacterium]
MEKLALVLTLITLFTIGLIIAMVVFQNYLLPNNNETGNYYRQAQKSKPDTRQ